MKYLEKLDAEDRVNETPRMERLRQIPPETGKFLSILACRLFYYVDSARLYRKRYQNKNL